ncbi:MAG: dTDP-4-amino-4,6-dideoxygalactose transaminase [Balneolales bacterium]
MDDFIPFNKPYKGQDEIDAVIRVLSGDYLCGDGNVTRRVHTLLENWLEVTHAFLTTSCTHSLEMAIMALDIGPGDEVIMPSFTFVSTANAVVMRGARPVFAEIQPGTLNIDPADVEQKITRKTKAIIPVHYGGVACAMDELLDLANIHKLYIIEDAAQAIDAKYKTNYLGTIGDIGCFSFHDTKNIMCGEGGALVTNNDKVARKAELLREKGTNRSAFIRGEVDKYTWMNVGSSYIPSDILAAILEVQISRKSKIKQLRKAVWETYFSTLQPLEEKEFITLPKVPSYASQNYHTFFLNTQTVEIRDLILKELRDNGIGATFHYIPLHSSPYGRQNLQCAQSLPHTDHLSQTLIRLPLYPDLANRAEDVADKVFDIIHRLSVMSSSIQKSK